MLVPILDFDHQVYANGARRAQQRPRRGVGCKAGAAGASLASANGRPFVYRSSKSGSADRDHWARRCRRRIQSRGSAVAGRNGRLDGPPDADLLHAMQANSGKARRSDSSRSTASTIAPELRSYENSGSQRTPRWREADSNSRSRGRRPASWAVSVHIRADYFSLAGNQQRRHEAVLDLGRVTRVHHAAFDAHLIGIDPDFRIRVSDRLLEIRDGPFLELGFSNRSVQAVAQSMCAIKRWDPASLPIYFRSSIEWTIL